MTPQQRLKSDRKIADTVFVTAFFMAGASFGVGSNIFGAICLVAALLSFEEIRNLTNAINHNKKIIR